MNIIIGHEVILRQLLKGNMYDSAIITDEFGAEIMLNDGIAAYIRLESTTPYGFKKGLVLWTAEGWENELKRREYLDGLPETNWEVQYKPKILERPVSKEDLRKKMMIAATDGNDEELARLKEQYKTLP